MATKRLKKKAGERVTLYHETSMGVLEQIVNSGQIMPGGFTDNIGGGHPSDPGKVPSGTENAVYLTDLNSMSDYSMNAIRNTPRAGGKLNFGVYIRVNVDTDALNNDSDDFTDLDPHSHLPNWKQSLRGSGQCMHYGPIFLDEIEGVSTTGFYGPGFTVEVEEKLGELLPIGTFFSVPDFMAKVQEFDQWRQEETLRQLSYNPFTARLRTRRQQLALMKLAGWIQLDKERPMAKDEEYRKGDDGCETYFQKGILSLDTLDTAVGYSGEDRQWTDNGDGTRSFGNYSEERWNQFLEDIKQNGVQRPIVVNVHSDGHLSIYEGNHRVEACRQLGINQIPAEVYYLGQSQVEHKII